MSDPARVYPVMYARCLKLTHTTDREWNARFHRLCRYIRERAAR